MKTKVKLCIIGSGRAGMIHARNFHYKIPQAEVIAISDMCVETAKSASVELDGIPYYCDYLEAIEKSGANAVVIATPDFVLPISYTTFSPPFQSFSTFSVFHNAFSVFNPFPCIDSSVKRMLSFFDLRYIICQFNQPLVRISPG